VLSRWVTLRGKDGAVLRRVGSLSDVTARKEAEGRLRREALYDALTGLPNRTLLTDRLRQALARARRHTEQMCGLLFLDVDRFKVVNDSLGHAMGDQLLCEVARRIERSVRPEDTVARLGGDEFTVLLEGVHGPKDATHAAERIQKGIARSFRLGETDVFVTVSIGIAISSGDYQQPEELIRDADTAMYRAKGAGKARHQLFDSRMHAQAMTMLNLENDLRRALERDEFEMHYQPIVQLEHPDIVGFEALVRWRHPTRGLVLPGEFIPLAEETGLIVPLGRWVLERACADARAWQREFPRDPPLTLSVNLSARQLVEVDLLDAIESILKRSGFDAHSLHLEITESVIMQRPDLVTVVLGRLKDLGIRVSIDDFGTGYSSLSYLHLFPVDCLKIDRSFVSSMQALGKQRRIVETILMLAKNLGIDVIAEGVEGEEQRKALHGLGCALAQGYLFSRPVDERGARRLLEAKAGPSPAA
jgi:diguanylate cyclase (GGDEF)-like protein